MLEKKNRVSENRVSKKVSSKTEILSVLLT